MSTALPDNPHDMALWLFDNLGDLACVAGSALWEGKLPSELDFDAVESHLEGLPGALNGTCRADNRIIGFYPGDAHVYEDMEHMLQTAGNRRRIPERFTLRDEGYSHPLIEGAPATPLAVARYLETVRLWSVLHDLADVRNGGLLFVASHDAQLEIRADFAASDLRDLPDFPRFTTEFGNHESHADQKHSIVRSSLIEQFKPRRGVAMSDVLAAFHDIATNARQSLAMYMAEFSVAKVKSEVERLNLEDTLSLNKTLADIQNQLLALPAAILLAGATIVDGQVLRNYAVMIGVAIFSIFILTMVSNQRHSINAIAAQISRRKVKVAGMPGDSGTKVLLLFDALEQRVKKQRRTLGFISGVVWLVVALTVLAVLDVNGQVKVIEGIARAWNLLANHTATTP